MNKTLITQPIGPNGEFGTITIALVNGKLVSSVNLSPKALIDSLAKDIGGPVPAEVATFLEGAIGLT